MSKEIINIREETPQDQTAIREVHLRAFGQNQEAELVDKLRQNCTNLLSLVAIRREQVVGHVLFSPCTLEGESKTVEGMGLAPVAVLPEWQRQGIGSELIRTGITELQGTQCPFVIVLGYPEYYPRFGFEPAVRHGIRSEWEVPADAFMILVFNESELQDISGVAKYRPNSPRQCESHGSIETPHKARRLGDVLLELFTQAMNCDIFNLRRLRLTIRPTPVATGGGRTSRSLFAE